ncbi:MAG: TolB family protein [Solirubrobacterales bacterium]
MNRLVAGVLVLAVLALAAASANAAAPEGPRLAILVQKYGQEMLVTGPLGEHPQQLVDSSKAVSGGPPSWSADGSRLAFAAHVPGDDDPVLGVADADGAHLRIYPDVPLDLGNAVMAPDGSSAAYTRVRVRRKSKRTIVVTASIWSFDFGAGKARKLTPWQGEFLMPSSYAPDGSTLAATGWDFRRFRAVAIDLQTGGTSLLARNAREPVYSPDGSSFAFVRWKPWLPEGELKEASNIGELRVGRVGVPVGSTSLARMRGLVSGPSWDPSGQRLAFVNSLDENPKDHGLEDGNRVMSVNADGTCLTKVFANPDMAVLGAAWQPGTGREAGPLTC